MLKLWESLLENIDKNLSIHIKKQKYYKDGKFLSGYNYANNLYSIKNEPFESILYSGKFSEALYTLINSLDEDLLVNKLGLRRHQAKVIKIFAKNKNKASLFKLCTGAGKTYIMQLISKLATMLEKDINKNDSFPIKNNGQIIPVIVTPTINLVDQGGNDNQALLEKLNDKQINDLRFTKTNHLMISSQSNHIKVDTLFACPTILDKYSVVICCNYSFLEIIKRYLEITKNKDHNEIKKYDHIKLIIFSRLIFFDECHLNLDHILEELSILYSANKDISEDILFSYFSATPNYKINFNRDNLPYLDISNKERATFSYSLNEASVDKVICPYILCRSKYIPHKKENIEEFIESSKLAKMLLYCTLPNGKAIRENSTIIFLPSINLVDLACNNLSNLGFKNVHAIHSNIKGLQNKINNILKSKLPHIIVVSGMLTKGFSYKDLTTALVFTGVYKGNNDAIKEDKCNKNIQKIGRVLRKNANDPEKIAFILANPSIVLPNNFEYLNGFEKAHSIFKNNFGNFMLHNSEFYINDIINNDIEECILKKSISEKSSFILAKDEENSTLGKRKYCQISNNDISNQINEVNYIDESEIGNNSSMEQLLYKKDFIFTSKIQNKNNSSKFKNIFDGYSSSEDEMIVEDKKENKDEDVNKTDNKRLKSLFNL